MTKLSTIAAAIATLSLGFGTGASAGTMDSVVNIQNNSGWEIHHLFLAPVDETNWGPDLLEGKVVESKGGNVEVHKIACDTYDVRLVDEDGGECVVSNISLCADKDAWSIDDDDLLACQAATAE